MDARVFDGFRELARRAAGMSLREDSQMLIEQRVAPRLLELELDSSAAYLRLLEEGGHPSELVEFLNAISTSFSGFFREAEHFGTLRTDVMRALEAGQRRFRIWCAAAASGEEPYSVAIQLADAFGPLPVDWRILATDISTRMLHRAALGLYRASELEPVRADWRDRYFTPAGQNAGGEALFKVAPVLQEHVVFRRLNLAEPPFPMQGPLDSVFCRNVMFYLERPVRQALVEESERLLKPGGTFFIGTAETLRDVHTNLRSVRSSVFVKDAGSGA